MNEDEKIELMQIWFNQYKAYESTLSRKDRLGFLRRFIAMGKDLQNEFKNNKDFSGHEFAKAQGE